MNFTGVSSPVGLQEEPVACPQCGSTSRVGNGFCLNCLLLRGLGDETFDSETLESVLDEVDVRDADWRLGNYQILEEIGRGGMGVIYRARQRHSRRIVALKRILAHHADSRDTLVRFRREAEAAASLDHPNILPIYEVSEGEDGLPFFSMKFAAGGSLLENQAALHSDTRTAVALMSKVSRAVEYAHSRGILHRDLKPGNILLDGRGEALVSDFGLAKWLDASSDLTRTLTIFGTPGYIAPEQAHGPASSLKATADIYSLGAILFDLIAGRPPFLGEHALSVIQQAAEKTAPRLRSINSKIDRDLETICARCLEREPSARYHSAGDLATDLERWLEGRPIIARPVSPAIRTWRWAKRSPKLAASVAGCVLGGVAILVITTFTFFGSARSSQIAPEKSIAVLPFQNLSDEKESAYFTDGVQDEILTDLAKVADLKVISRTSVMQYKSSARRNLREIAKQLGVAHVLEGSVQRAGGRVRISAQLVDARTDTHQWAEQYERDIADIFAVESEVSEKIVAQLKSKLSPAEKAAIETPATNDHVAYDFYLRAKDLFEKANFTGGRSKLFEAERLLKNAIQRDSNFFRAYCLLATVHDDLYLRGVDHTADRLALAQDAIDSAVRLQPESGEVSLIQAQHRYWGYFDYGTALEKLQLAQRLLPNEPNVYVLAAFIDRRRGLWDDSMRNFDRALNLDPRNSFLLQQVAISYSWQHRFREAAELLDRALVIAPDNNDVSVQRGNVDLDWRGDTKYLHRAIQSIISTDQNAATSVADDWLWLALSEHDLSGATQALAMMGSAGARDISFSFPRSWCEAIVAREKGESVAEHRALVAARQEVEAIVRQQPDYGEPLCILGMIDAALGRKNDAIREADRALELVPPTRDYMNNALLQEYRAVTYACVGEKEKALAQLRSVLSKPSPTTYGDLKLHPYWKPLRGDPRFAKIIASLAPK